MVTSSEYRPTCGSMNGHIASVFGYLKLPLRLHGGVREKVPLRDGGQCVLHWWSDRPNCIRRPVVMIIHGINNNSDTPYLQYLSSRLESAGFCAVTANMRGHGHGNGITSARLYRARCDDDVQQLAEFIRVRHPSIPALYAIGFSMGANQLCCFLATSNTSYLPHAPTRPTRLVDAAISISNPFDLPRLNEHFKHGIAVLYTALVAQPLKKILWEVPCRRVACLRTALSPAACLYV